MIKKAVLLFTSLLVSILLAEIIIQWTIPVREVGSVLSIHDTELGKRLRPSVTTVRESPEFTMNFSTNSEGFRGPERQVLGDSVLFLGDSFTMGYGVSDGSEYPAIIGALLSERFPERIIEAINAGVGNNGNGQWVKFLRRYLTELDPAIVVLQFMQNDFDDNVREGYFSLTEDERLIENEISLSWARRVEGAMAAVPFVTNSHLYAAVREAHYLWSRSRPIEADALIKPMMIDGAEASEYENLSYKYRLARALVVEAVHMCQSAGYPVIAMLVGLDGAELAEVQSWFHSRSVPVVKFPSRFERPDLYFKIDGHWNEAGHAYAAHVLTRVLVTQLGTSSSLLVDY